MQERTVIFRFFYLCLMASMNLFNKSFNLSMSPLEQFSVSKTSISILSFFKFEVDNNFLLFFLSCNKNHFQCFGDSYITDSKDIILPSLSNFFTNISFLRLILFFFLQNQPNFWMISLFLSEILQQYFYLLCTYWKIINEKPIY